MKKSKRKLSAAAHFPEAYRFLWQAVVTYYRDDAGKTFFQLPEEKQVFYQQVVAQRAALPVETRLLLSAFYKKFPAKKWAETQQIQGFLMQLNAWRNTAVLEHLPPELSYLCEPVTQAALWSAEDVEPLTQGADGAAFLKGLGDVKREWVANNHRAMSDAFLEQFPADFFYESAMLKAYLVALEQFEG